MKNHRYTAHTTENWPFWKDCLLKSCLLHSSPTITALWMVLPHHSSTIIFRDINLTKLRYANIGLASPGLFWSECWHCYPYLTFFWEVCQLQLCPQTQSPCSYQTSSIDSLFFWKRNKSNHEKLWVLWPCSRSLAIWVERVDQGPALPKSCLLYPSPTITALPIALSHHSSIILFEDLNLTKLGVCLYLC